MVRARLLLILFVASFALLWVIGGPHVRPPRTPNPLPRLPVAANSEALSDVPLSLHSVARIPGGTVLGDRAPVGWTQILLLVQPRLGAGDVSALPEIAARYARMFQLAILARTRMDSTAAGLRCVLDRVAVGYAVDAGERKVVLARGHTLEGNLDFIGQRVFEKNDAMLGELTDVGRSATAIVIDAPAIVLRDGQHRHLIYRHLVTLDPDSGKLTLLVWLLEPTASGNHTPVDDAVRVPPGLHEDRVLSVKKEKVSLIGVPADDALALVGLPKEGMRVRFTPVLREAAGRRRYSPATLAQLERAVRAAVE